MNIDFKLSNVAKFDKFVELLNTSGRKDLNDMLRSFIKVLDKESNRHRILKVCI